MAKKKVPPKKKSSPSSKPANKTKTKKYSRKNSTSPTGQLTKAIERIDLHSERNVQPGWIREEHPEYVEQHMLHHALRSVRKDTHDGHMIKVTTTYEIEIDGVPVRFHAFVDNEGRLRCHSTPYESYASAVELVKTLMDRFPQSFGPASSDHTQNQQQGSV